MKHMSLVIACLALPMALLGYGQNGHRVVGAVAEAHLNKKAQKAVENLLDGHSLAYVSTYMDEVKSDDNFDHTHSWHWVTIPDGKRYPETEKNEEGDLIEAIERMQHTLSCEDSSRASRVEALKFLVHLMGDLHQPLHVGNGTDRGGNDVKVEWFGRRSNLHRVWDSEMLKSRDFAYSELAAELLATTKKDQVRQWSRGTVMEWAHEIMQYRSQVYRIENPEYMGYQYTYRNWELLTTELAKGGVRLAAVLNEILG